MDVGRYTISAAILFSLTACGSSRSSTAIVAQATPKCQSTSIQGQYIVQWKDGHYSVERAKSREDFIADFVERNLDQIEFAELDQRIQMKSEVATASETVPANWGQDVVHAQDAWNQNAHGQGVIVAVIDSGLDTTHPQLKDQLYVNSKEIVNGVDDDGNGYIDDISGWNFSPAEGPGTPTVLDENGHGTHVSGIIAADSTKGTIAGMAQQAKLLPLQFMDASGAGSISRAIAAIEYAAKMGAKVINASWGTVGCNKSLENAVAKLQTEGVLFVTAAGNDYGDLAAIPSYPAAFNLPGQLTVGALTYSGFRADFSNYGPLVHLVAPGSPIYSTVPTSKGTYGFMNGTSMAAPFVSGAAALLWSAHPSATISQIRDAILNSVEVKDYLNVLTHGQLDVGAAIRLLSQP